MDSRLFGKAFSKFLAGLLIVGLLLFIPAGTIAYWQAWLLIIILFVPMFIAGLILMKKNPDLLRKRLNVKEEQTEQKGSYCRPQVPLQQRSFSCWPMPCMRKCFGKILIFHGQWKYRRIRKSLIPDSTA